jgi:serine/threonine protein phosphatase PrpC
MSYNTNNIQPQNLSAIYARMYQLHTNVGEKLSRIVDDSDTCRQTPDTWCRLIHLPQGIQNEIYTQVCVLAGQPQTDNGRWGKHNWFCDLNRLQGAIQKVAYNHFCAMPDVLKNCIARRIWRNNGSQKDVDSLIWGRNHANDNAGILFHSLIEGTRWHDLFRFFIEEASWKATHVNDEGFILFRSLIGQGEGFADGDYIDDNLIEDINRHIGDVQTPAESKFERHMRYAKEQMNRESIKSFVYSQAPTDWQQVVVNGHVQEETVGNLPVGICHAQGRRRSMEDEHIDVQFNVRIGNTEYPIQLFGVFDGHSAPGLCDEPGGRAISQFLRDRLQGKIQETMSEFNPNGLSDEGILSALKMACIRINCELQTERGGALAWEQGSTATFAMILDGNLWTANVGDSRTVLDNNGTAVQLTEDAKPEAPRFKKKIEKRGGCVFRRLDDNQEMRVNGFLSIGAAFGDFCLNGAITASPKVTKKPLSEIQPNSHLILCCDGVFDVARTEDVVRAAHDNQNLTAGDLAKNIVYSAFSSGSDDNISVLVVKIR